MTIQPWNARRMGSLAHLAYGLHIEPRWGGSSLDAGLRGVPLLACGMVDTASLAEDLTRLEFLLRTLLAAARRPGMLVRLSSPPGHATPGTAREPAPAMGLTSQHYRSCEGLLPALDAAVGILRRLSRAALTLDTVSDEELRRRFHLTRREIEVLRLLLLGRSNADVARFLGISEHTARHHTERIRSKLNVHSRAQLAAAIVARAW